MAFTKRKAFPESSSDFKIDVEQSVGIRVGLKPTLAGDPDTAWYTRTRTPRMVKTLLLVFNSVHTSSGQRARVARALFTLHPVGVGNIAVCRNDRFRVVQNRAQRPKLLLCP